jgi:hypothetical protein
LRINYGCRKTWRALCYLKRVDKDAKRVSIPTTYKHLQAGLDPHLKLKEAREKPRQFLADPQKAKARAATDSFKAVAENFLKRHVESNKLRSQPEIGRILSEYAHPASSSEGQSWAERPFCDIRRVKSMS